MNAPENAGTIRKHLSSLVGQRLVRSRNFCATRHFYFGQENLDAAFLYTLGVDCPWRIRRHDTIVAGAADYYVRAEDNLAESWEVGTATGHLQNQKLAELLGELKGDLILNTGADLVVRSVEADGCGGFRIDMAGDCVLEVFPSSRSQMEWIFMLPLPRRRAWVFMNGVLNRTAGKTRRPKVAPSKTAKTGQPKLRETRDSIRNP